MNSALTARARHSALAWEALFRTQAAVVRRISKGPEFQELSMREYDILFNISRFPAHRVRFSDLIDSLIISQPSLSREVERLVQRGLLIRERDPNDRRSVLVGLTEQGRALQRSIGMQHVRELHKLLGTALEPEELDTLRALCIKLMNHLPPEDAPSRRCAGPRE